MKTVETKYGKVIISEDKGLLDIPYIFDYLHHKSYWAPGVPMNVVQRSIEHSYCFGLYLDKKQIGFARVITDQSTFGYLADVFIDEHFRGMGLSKRLMEYILAHPDLQGFRSWLLGTKDAHGLYAQFGFTALPSPERFMRKHNPDVYKHTTA